MVVPVVRFRSRTTPRPRRRLQAVSDREPLVIRVEFSFPILADREIRQKPIILLLTDLPQPFPFVLDRLDFIGGEFAHNWHTIVSFPLCIEQKTTILAQNAGNGK